jgi:DNA-binding GntR family transcriptional regulator
VKAESFDSAQLKALAGELRPQAATVQELILAVVRRAVLAGIVQPGVKLGQEDLASIFGTSRIPVREALRVLEHEGLVRSEPHRGFAVTALDADQVEEVYELRIVLEAHAIREAIPLLTESDLAELDQLHDEMERGGDPETQLERRERFYMRLYSVTARPRLVGLIARLHQEVARSLRWKLVQHSPTQHQAVYEAIRRGDADAAVEELTQHYRKVAALIRRFLRQGELAKDAPLAATVDRSPSDGASGSS